MATRQTALFMEEQSECQHSSTTQSRPCRNSKFLWMLIVAEIPIFCGCLPQQMVMASSMVNDSLSHSTPEKNRRLALQVLQLYKCLGQ